MRTTLKLSAAAALAALLAAPFAVAQESGDQAPGRMMPGGDDAMRGDMSNMQGMMPMMQMMQQMGPMMEQCTEMMAAMTDHMKAAPQTHDDKG